MASSPVEICNSALIKLGAGTITALDNNSPRAILCNQQYSRLRDETLAAHFWNFAMKRATLAALTSVPAYDWTAEYQLPADCLRVKNTENETDFKVEGRKILSNVSSSLNVNYIFQNTDVAQYSPCYVEALACRIAADLAYALTNSNTVQAAQMAAYKAQLSLARSIDSQEGTPDPIEADLWIRTRFMGNGSGSGTPWERGW